MIERINAICVVSIPAAPPSSKSGSDKLIAVSVVVLCTVIPIAIAGFLLYMQQIPPDHSEVFSSVGLSVENYSNGNWTVAVTRGNVTVSDVYLIVVIPSNGTQTVFKAFVNLTLSVNDTDATYYDNNGNARLDIGDKLILKSAGGHILSGYKVQLLRRDDRISTIRELPT